VFLGLRSDKPAKEVRREPDDGGAAGDEAGDEAHDEAHDDPREEVDDDG
jgi:hypothetical protein